MRSWLVLGLWLTCNAWVGQAASLSDAEFERISRDFVTTHFAQRPLEAVALGWHSYDGLFPNLDRHTLRTEVERLKHYAGLLSALSTEGLSTEHRADLWLLRSTVASELWKLETQKAPERNPMFYAGAIDVSIYLKRDFAPLPERIRFLTRVIEHAPRVFQAARQNLDDRLAKPFVETAIEVAEGNAQFLEKDVALEAAKVSDPLIRQPFEAANRIAIAEHRAFVSWLKTKKLPSAHTHFALGRAGYHQMLLSERIDLSPDQLLELGMKELKAEQARLRAAAHLIDASKDPKDVYDTLSREHPTATNLIPHVAATLEKARQFVVDHHLVSMPTEVRARVQETLPPFRATSTASMDTPGPFEKKATEAYYYVTPVESDWTPKQAEEWLQTFNDYTTEIVNIHEAYPGHYIQNAVLNQSPLSSAAKVFGSYAFIEGWAHYCEQMLLEEGYGGSDPIRDAKFRIAQSSEALLRICRLCVSVRMHCMGMSVDEATRFIMENAFYTEKAAKPEAVRGTFDPGYCFYTLGKLQLLKLRRDWQAQEGPQFSLQRFHDTVLRSGAPQIRTLREQMLRDSKAWSQVLP